MKAEKENPAKLRGFFLRCKKVREKYHYIYQTDR